MGCCCSSNASQDNEFLRVIIFGLENSGKTSLVHCLKTSTQIDQTSQSISTHGVIAMNINLNIQTNLNLIIFDCGGCKHQRHIWPHLMNNSDLVLFTIDSHDETCFNDARQALFDLLTDESLANKPLLIVLTKSDQEIRKTIRQLDQTLELYSIEDRPIHRVLFSSITLDGLTTISAWFAYFDYCKRHGKDMKVSNLSTSKYRLPQSLHLSKLPISTFEPSKSKKSHRLTVPNRKKPRRSSVEKNKKSSKRVSFDNS